MPENEKTTDKELLEQLNALFDGVKNVLTENIFRIGHAQSRVDMIASALALCTDALMHKYDNDDFGAFQLLIYDLFAVFDELEESHKSLVTLNRRKEDE